MERVGPSPKFVSPNVLTVRDTRRTMGYMSPKPPMVQKNFRIPAALYAAAMAKAAERQQNLSDVIRDALASYIED